MDYKKKCNKIGRDKIARKNNNNQKKKYKTQK
jgi:hypothetical protein